MQKPVPICVLIVDIDAEYLFERSNRPLDLAVTLWMVRRRTDFGDSKTFHNSRIRLDSKFTP